MAQSLSAPPDGSLTGPITGTLRALGQPLPVLMAFMVAVFLLGGGSRDDILSLAILRPLSVLVLGYAIIIANPAHLRINRALLGFAGAWTALVALHLVPLPPALWQALPGRELVIEIDRVTGFADQWRPLSLVPHRTLNSLLSLTVPLAALLLALQLSRRELVWSVIALGGLGLLSAFVGLLQVSGTGEQLYFYRITNADSAVGLFANRNHHAIMLSLTIAMIGGVPALLRSKLGPKRMAGRERAITLASGGLALALLPFLIVTQSRAGLILGALALVVAFWLLHRDATRNTGGNAPAKGAVLALAGMVGAGVLAALTYLFTAGNALDRLTRSGSADDGLRLAIWGPTLEQALAHFPAGSGFGTFVEVFQTAEPASTLGPSYINRAHNDWLEIVLTGGAPALVILAVALVWLVMRASEAMLRASGGDLVLRQLGCAALALCALGSLYDYPLRTPSLAIAFILALVWIAGRDPKASPENTEKSARTNGSRNQDRHHDAHP